MQINQNVFIHDSDRTALAALKAIPGFTQLLKAFSLSETEGIRT